MGTTQGSPAKDRLTGMSLRLKLIIAFAAMAVIPLLVANLVASRVYEKAITTSVFEKNRKLAETIAGVVNQMISEKVRMVKVAVNSPEISSMNPARQQPVLGSLAVQHRDLLIALTASNSGDLLARSDGNRSTINYSERDYFKKALSTGGTAISDVLVSKTTGKLGIAIAEPIRDAADITTGMLIVTVDLQKIIDLVAQTRIGRNGYAFLVNAEGKVLIHPERALVESAANVSSLAPVKAAIEGKSGWVEYEFRGQRRLAAYSYLPNTRWGLIVQQPLDDALEDISSVRKGNLVIIAMTMLVAIGFAFVLAGYLFRPISILISAAEKVASGDLSAHAECRSGDEIGHLATAFNNMTVQLSARDEALRKSREKYRRIVDTANEGIWVLDESSKTTFVNSRMAEMLGCSPEELIGNNVEQHLFAEDVEAYRRKAEQIPKGQFEQRWRKCDGSELWTIVSTQTITDAGQRTYGSFAMLTDITERKRNEMLMLENAQITRELEIAQEIQRTFLSACPLDIPGVMMACSCQPAAHVGGDYYDYFVLENGIIDAVIADITGHNVGSALLMSETHSVLHTLAGLSRTPSCMLTEVNRRLYVDLIRAELQISMFYVRIDTINNIVTYASAGHNRPLLLHSVDNNISELDAEGMILGVMPEMFFEEKRLQVSPGDLLFMYTDGLTDVENSQKEFFGMERLKDQIRCSSHLHPRDIVADVSRSLELFSGSRPHSDDIAMFAIKIIGSNTEGQDA